MPARLAIWWRQQDPFGPATVVFALATLPLIVLAAVLHHPRLIPLGMELWFPAIALTAARHDFIERGIAYSARVAERWGNRGNRTWTLEQAAQVKLMYIVTSAVGFTYFLWDLVANGPFSRVSF